MADKKISQLTASTTPLAGTEVLPVVQSGDTKQVSVANLTAGRPVSAASFEPTSATVPTNGVFLGAANSVSIATGSTEHWMVNALGNLNPVGAKGIGSLLAPVKGVAVAPNVGVSFGPNGFLYGGDSTDMYFGTNAAYNIRLYTNGAEGFRLGSNGDATLFTGNLVIGTSGKGIDFSADGQAAGMTSELLDDYEEGTWTPVVRYSGTNTPTIATQVGKYTKVGRIVSAQAIVSWNENGSTGDVDITGLPFVSSSSVARAVASVFSFGFTGLPANISISAWVLSSDTVFQLFLNDNAATRVTDTYTDNDQDLYLTVTYEVA